MTVCHGVPTHPKVKSAHPAMSSPEIQAGIRKLETALGVILDALPRMQTANGPSMKKYILFLCANERVQTPKEAWDLVNCAEEIAPALGWNLS